LILYDDFLLAFVETEDCVLFCLERGINCVLTFDKVSFISVRVRTMSVGMWSGLQKQSYCLRLCVSVMAGGDQLCTDFGRHELPYCPGPYNGFGMSICLQEQSYFW
jgi:hypothetical protein